MTIVLATQNTHKLKEFQTIFKNTRYSVRSFSEFFAPLEIIENGSSFAENAMIKANAMFMHLDKYVENLEEYIVLAEDSGLCIEALGGEPGVYSARYGIWKNTSLQDNSSFANAHQNSSDKENLLCVIRELQAKGLSESKACFVANIALVGVNIAQNFEATLEGVAITQVLGNNGFGYDPIFIPTLNNPHSLTLSQISSEVKNTISHRFFALQKCLAFLEGL